MKRADTLHQDLDVIVNQFLLFGFVYYLPEARDEGADYSEFYPQRYVYRCKQVSEQQDRGSLYEIIDSITVGHGTIYTQQR